MPAPITPGLLILHGNRLEDLRRLVSDWTGQHRALDAQRGEVRRGVARLDGERFAQVPRSFVSRRITLPDYLWFLAPSGKAS